jgi:hypothetical protein
MYVATLSPFGGCGKSFAIFLIAFCFTPLVTKRPKNDKKDQGEIQIQIQIQTKQVTTFFLL